MQLHASMRIFAVRPAARALLLGALLCSSALGQPKPTCPAIGWDESLGDNLGATAPFPVSDTMNPPPSDCGFHQWSWEAFAWAVWIDPSTSLPRFLSLPTTADLGQAKVSAKGPGTLVLKLRSQKPLKGVAPIDEFQQAGSAGVIIDQNGQPVFYSVHMNQTYFDFAQTYYGIANFEKAPATLNFPVGSAVFKASWRVMPAGTPPGNIFTTQAKVPVFVNNPKGGIMLDPSGAMRVVTVGLIGLHVVGVTENHPEFLWATFEHLQNAPALLDPALYNQPLPVSVKDFAFYKAGTLATACNTFDAAKLQVVDAAAQTLAPVTNVFRQYAYGGGSATDDTEIKAINADAQNFMANKAGQTVWANYFLVGTVWQKPNSLQPGDSTMDATAVGCVNLANATMETFVQGPQHNDGKAMNCFTCHNTAGDASHGLPAKNINTSHTLDGPFFTTGAPLPAHAGK